MVPMRDGVHLQTVVIAKANQTQPLPILLTRTPYGVLTQEDFDKHAEKDGPDWVPDSWKELAADGYIFVWQNLRGRFKSEGAFLLTSQYDPKDPKPTQRNQRCLRHRGLARQKRPQQQRQGGHLRHLLQRTHRRR